jgi:hypothetical protein
MGKEREGQREMFRVTHKPIMPTVNVTRAECPPLPAPIKVETNSVLNVPNAKQLISDSFSFHLWVSRQVAASLCV